MAPINLALMVSYFAMFASAYLRMGSDNCTTSGLNTTIGSWTTTSTDTIFSISAATKRGICDIARSNRMTDATLVVAGQHLIIPAEVCEPDNSTCLITDASYATTCLSGGLHTYNTRYNDTRQKIASKFKVSLDTITVGFGDSDPGVIITTDSQIKIPQCSPSQCDVQPFLFVYGTYKDLAEQYNTSVGQIMAFNPTYTYSGDTNVTGGPVISLPMNCRNLSDSVQIIS